MIVKLPKGDDDRLVFFVLLLLVRMMRLLQFFQIFLSTKRVREEKAHVSCLSPGQRGRGEILFLRQEIIRRHLHHFFVGREFV